MIETTRLPADPGAVQNTLYSVLNHNDELGFYPESLSHIESAANVMRLAANNQVLVAQLPIGAKYYECRKTYFTECQSIPGQAALSCEKRAKWTVDRKIYNWTQAIKDKALIDVGEDPNRYRFLKKAGALSCCEQLNKKERNLA